MESKHVKSDKEKVTDIMFQIAEIVMLSEVEGDKTTIDLKPVYSAILKLLRKEKAESFEKGYQDATNRYKERERLEKK